MAGKFIIPIHVPITGDASQLREELSSLVSQTATSIAALARQRGQTPEGTAASARRQLGQFQGSLYGQIQAREEAGAYATPELAAQARRAVDSMVDQVRSALGEQLGAEVARPTAGFIGAGRTVGYQSEQETIARERRTLARQAVNAQSVNTAPPSEQLAAMAPLLEQAQAQAAAAAQASAGTALSEEELAAQNRQLVIARARELIDANLAWSSARGAARTPEVIAQQGVEKAATTVQNSQESTVANRAILEDPESVAVMGEENASRRLLAAAKRAEADATIAASGEEVGILSEEKIAKEALARAVRLETFERMEAAGQLQTGTGFQRFLASAKQRTGGPTINPLDQPTLGQSFKGRFATTAQFALSGAALYGGIRMGGEILKESEALQQELAIVRTQFENVDKTANSITFAAFRQQLQDTAVETGVAADQVAKVERQLAGAFADSQGHPDFAKASTEGRTALEYSKVSGLPQQEITDSLTAISLAFKTADNQPLPFKNVVDTVTDLENRFGVLGPEIIKFTADLAPLGKELGFTAQQLAGLGAVAQQASGKSGQVLAAELGRILPSLKDKKQDLYDLLDSNARTRSAAPQLASAFAKGDTPEALAVLIRNYDKLDKAQQNVLATAVGRRREAGTFYALVDRKDQSLQVLDGGGAQNADGAFAKRWESYKQTVSYAVAQMKRSIEEFGQILFQAGIADVLKGGADAAREFAAVAVVLAKALGAINSALGGLPGKAAGYALLFAGLAKSFAIIRGTQIGGMFAGGAGGLAAPGGFFSPYRAGAPILNEAGTATGAFGAPALRPSTALAARSPILSGGLTLGEDGAVAAGLGTAAVSAAAVIAPIAVAMFAGYTASTISSWNKGIKASGESFRAKIAKLVAKGVSQDEITRIAREKYGLDDRHNAFFEGATDIFGGETQSDSRYRILNEEFTRSNASGIRAQIQVISNLHGKQRTKALASVKNTLQKLAKGGGLSDDEKSAIAEVFNGDLHSNTHFDITSPNLHLDINPFNGGGAPAFTNTTTSIGAGSNFNVTSKSIRRLADLIKKNPTNKGYQELAKRLYGAADIDEATQALLRSALLGAMGDKKTAEAELAKAGRSAAEQAQQGAFDTRLAIDQSQLATGAEGIGPIVTLIRHRIKTIADQRAKDLKQGLDVSDYDKQLADLVKTLTDQTVISEANALRTLQDQITKASGQTGIAPALAQLHSAAAAYDAIRSTHETDINQRGTAAMNLVLAQQELVTAQLKAAGTPEQINQIVAQAGAISNHQRTDIIGSQLAHGDNTKVVDAVKAATGKSYGEARQFIIDALTQSDSIADSAQVALLKSQEQEAKATIDRINNIKKGSRSKGQKRALASAQDAYNKLEKALGLIGTVDVVDPDNRRSGIDSQLQPGGSNDAQIAAVAAALGKNKAQTRASVITAITGHGGVAASALRKDLEDRKKADQDVLSQYGDLRGKSDQIDEVLAGFQADYNTTVAAINALLKVKVTDPVTLAGLQATGALNAGNNAILKAQAGDDPVKQAQAAAKAAKDAFTTIDPNDGPAIRLGLAAIIDANNSVDTAIRTRADTLRHAAFDLKKIAASGDPVAQAAISAQQAASDLAHARTPEEISAAQIAGAQASEDQRNAAQEVLKAQGSYAAALLSGDSVAQARQQLANAQQALGAARGEAEKYAALQQVYEAQQTLRNSLLDVFIAQKDLAIAVAEGAGQTVQVAILQLQEAQERLRSAQAAGVKGAQLDQLRAQVQQQQNNVVNVTRQDRLGDLDYLFQMDRITATQYIGYLEQVLRTIPESNKQARQEIALKIKGLRDSLSQDLALNIPSEIKIPTLYEARRLNQIASTNFGSSYQDNRNIQVIITGIVGPDEAAAAVTKAINAPPRNSPTGVMSATSF